MPDFLPPFTFIPFTGVVEDNNDPLFLGRVRVRVHGFYSDDTTDVPTDTLPWAHVQYTNSKSAIIPEVNEWVFGMFLDGKEAQKPLVIGVLPGITEEPSTSRFARNEEVEDTSIHSKKEETTTLRSITEPSNPYGAEYPNNRVIETSSGHLIEIDDTNGSERIHIYHKSGTFSEVHPDGSMVNRVEGETYNVSKDNRYTIVLGDEIHEIEGMLKIENSSGAVVEMDSTGLVSIHNNQSSLHDLLNDLLLEVSSITTSGSPSNHVINTNHTLKFTEILTQMKLLLK